MLKYKKTLKQNKTQKNKPQNKLPPLTVFAEHLMCYCYKTKPGRKAVELENILRYTTSKYCACKYNNAAAPPQS